MVRRFSWCTVVALVVLLFVTAEGLRERSTQVDDDKTHNAKDRGTLRYNFKSPEEATTSASSLSRTRSSRDRTSNLERHNGGSVSKPSISEGKVESNRRSNFRTARTTERNGVSVATETTNTSRRTLEKDSSYAKKVEPTINRRNGKRHPSENAEAAKSKVEEQNGTQQISRRTFNKKSDYSGVTERLDNTGPSIFTATTEFSRTRTGRKIQTSYSTTDLKTQVPTSRKFNNKKFEGVETTTTAFRRSESRGRSTTERTDRGRSGRSKVNNRENNAINRRSDSILSESESVRVDIPLAVQATESLAVEATTDPNVRPQRQSSIDTHKGSEKDTARSNSRTGSERLKSRGRSSDTDATDSVSKSSSRRGSSRFHEYSTTETSEQFVSSRRNTVPRDRSKNLEPKRSSTNEGRPRSRGRNLEHNGKSNLIATSERDVKRKSAGDRISPERRSRVPDLGLNAAENRGQDQDTRGRTRSRSRVDVTTPVSTSVDAITTVAPDTTVSNDIATTSTETEVTSTTARAATPTTTATSRTLTTTARSTSTTASSEGSGRNRNRGRGGGSQGRKQPKEDFFNHGLGFRGRKPSTEGAPDVGDSRKPTASKNESQYHGNPGWTLRRRPGHLNNSETVVKAMVPSSKDQTNEVIPPSELSTSTEIITSVESVTATTRRGFKKQQSSTEESSTVAGTTSKSFRRGNKTFDKSKTSALGKGAAELEEGDNYPPEFKARLSQLKITNIKPPTQKTTSRTPVEVKKSSAALFAERSRMKLDLARRLVKPELNIEENDLDATTASSFSKPTSTSSAGDGTSKVAKFVKPGAAERRGSTEASDVDKGSKLFRSGKSFEDSKSTGRSSALRKGRVISERMVTSISVEERPQEITNSYTSTNPSASTVFAEEGSATTIDSTRVRLSALRGSKKSTEDDKLSRGTNYSVTTFKPKKPYVYQSRNSKTQDQSTTVEQTSVTATPKKSHSTTKHNTTQRKSQASQEELVTKKPKFTEVSSSIAKSTLRPRYGKRGKAKSVEEKTEDETLTTGVPLATSRYSRKKSIIKSADKVKVTTTAGPVTQTRKQEFRPRTATYRRHSEVPTTLVETTTKVDAGVAITPRVSRYHASLKSSTPSPRSVPQEPQVNLNIVNDTAQQAVGITGSSNGDSGSTNIFNPARSVAATVNNTLLEQLRSTVAPLLSSLGNKTPIFSGSYSNVNNANSAPRITPSGSPPRFSARYKGAELFVRKQNNIYQPTVPSITSSSTTPVTPVENSGLAPSIDVSSPGEPRFLTFYHALETASIRNEQLQGNSSVQGPVQVGVVPQVDSNATVANGISSNSNNDTTSPTVATTSPQTPDTTTVKDSAQSPKLAEETENSTPMVTTGAPESPSSTVQARTESPSTTEQVATSTVSSSTEQAATSTESSSTTQQASLNTESSSTTEQASTTAGSVSTTQQPTTESVPRNTDTTTVAEVRDVTIFARIDTENATMNSTENTTPGNQNLVSSSAPSTMASMDVPTTTQITSTTEATTPLSSNDSTSTSENPESNTIESSEATSTEADVTSTAASTTEAVSDNMIDVETTTSIPTTTFRSRLIDFAQDILSRLQSSLSTTTEPTILTTRIGMVPTTVPPTVPTTISRQDSTTTVSPVTEISNVISDSDRKNTLESLAQLKEGTTTPGDLETTTLSSSTTDQPAVRVAEETTTQSAVGLVTTPSPATATEQSNDMVSTQEANTEEMDSVDTSTPTPTTVTTQDSQTVSNTDSTTVSVTTSTTNDTLLTELMSIAKTLLSEERNETERTTSVQNPDTSSRLGDSMESEVDQLGATQATESSVSPDVTTETVDSTSTTVAIPEVTTPADPSQNEVDSESTSDAPTTTARSSVPDSEVEVIDANQATTLGSLAANVESTTSPVTTETAPQTTLSDTTPNTTQSQTTQSSETTIASTVNYELTTNTYDLVSNLLTTTETQTSGQTEAATETTETVQSTNSATVVPQPTLNTSTNEPEVTTVSTDTENILSRVNMVTTMPSVSSESIIEQTTVPATESAQNETDMLTTTALEVDSMDITEATTNQSPLTSSTDLIMELTTNTPSETTIIPQTTQNPENETVVARFQDTTSATAQRTAGSGIGQTTESSSMITDSPTTPASVSSTSPPQSSVATTSPSVETTTATTTMTTETATSTSTGRPDERTTSETTTVSARNVATVTPMSETTVQMPITTVDISENLVSTEAPAAMATTTVSPNNASLGSRIGDAMNNTMNDAASNATAATETTTGATPGMTMPSATRPPGSPVPQTPSTPYLGRFGGARLTPAPRFSLSSTTKAPLRDYLIYGIYPNKTIVRKRPEDNLIDARNVDSPYVIFGIFPDGKLVRKFPNGTIIPDPPSSPVEVVFTLSTTTTTNRPPLRPYYNQANQGTYNQYQGPVYDNNRSPVAEPMRNVQRPGTVDLGLTGNAIVGPNGGGPDFTGPLATPASVPSTNEMSNTPTNAQMGTTSNAMSAIAGRPPTDSQGSRIVQDRERDEATRTKEAGGQRSSVYIGQDKFVNYWTNGAPTTNPRVVSVNINSVASASSAGPSPSVPSFENLLSNQPGGQITAPPGFPWRDPLDQIFGITTPSPVITASVASNTLDDSNDANGPVFARPVNPFVEVFTPFSSAVGNIRNGVVPTTQPTTATAGTTAAPQTTTTTTAASTTSTTTMASTTTVTPAPTTTTTTTTTTMAPTTTTTTTTTTAAPVPVTTTGAPPGTTVNSLPSTTSFNLPRNAFQNMQQQNAFGTSFDDLAFLNSLLQENSRGATPKTLTQVEQLLANKILSLALNNPGPTRAPKAINVENVSPNSIYQFPPKSLVDPIVIDLSPSSTAATPIWKPTEPSTEKPISTTTIKPLVQSTPTSTTSKTTLISTTKAPIAVTAKTTVRPRTTTPPALGFGASLWQALFGNGLFAPPTTQRPVKPKPVKTTPKSVSITPKPVPATQKLETTTSRTVDVSKIQVSTPNSLVEEVKSATARPLSTTKQPLLNNPNPRLSSVATSTFSPEDDAKFLLALLKAAQAEENKATAPKKSPGLGDDESFLRAILSGRALTTTTTPAPSNDISDAALLAALLKAQGIEPPTPATNIREQLLLASLGQIVGSAPNSLPAAESTTITTRPAPSATRPTVTTKKSVTPRPTSGPRIRTTTWSPSSTYPPPLFSSFSNYDNSAQPAAGGNNPGGGALFGATRAFSQFLGAALSGAAQQLQSLVRNGTRIVSEVVG